MPRNIPIPLTEQLVLLHIILFPYENSD